MRLRESMKTPARRPFTPCPTVIMISAKITMLMTRLSASPSVGMPGAQLGLLRAVRKSIAMSISSPTVWAVVHLLAVMCPSRVFRTIAVYGNRFGLLLSSGFFEYLPGLTTLLWSIASQLVSLVKLKKDNSPFSVSAAEFRNPGRHFSDGLHVARDRRT